MINYASLKKKKSRIPPSNVLSSDHPWQSESFIDDPLYRIKRLTSTAKQLSAKCELQIEQLREKDVTIQVRLHIPFTLRMDTHSLG